jgi:hypothetical protein
MRLYSHLLQYLMNEEYLISSSVTLESTMMISNNLVYVQCQP